MFKLFGIPNCDTVKKSRSFLEKKKVEVEFSDFKKVPPSTDDIKRWAEAFGELPVNKKGLTFKKHKDEYEILSKKDQIEFIKTHASMIKRPILEKNGKVLAFGFDQDEYQKIFK